MYYPEHYYPIDATVIIDMFRDLTSEQLAYNSVSKFLYEMVEHNKRMYITMTVFFEIIKNLRCTIFKDLTWNDFNNKIKRLMRFFNQNRIDILYLSNNDVRKFLRNFSIIDFNLCNCDVGEISLLTKDIDNIVMLSSDKKCFKHLGIRYKDPREYNGKNIDEWLST